MYLIDQKYKLKWLVESKRDIEARKMRQQNEKLVLPEVNGQIYIYSGKSTIYKLPEKANAQRLSKFKMLPLRTARVSIADYVLVNEDDIEKMHKASVAKYTTPSGFVYPAPKIPQNIQSTRDRSRNKARWADMDWKPVSGRTSRAFISITCWPKILILSLLLSRNFWWL